MALSLCKTAVNQSKKNFGQISSFSSELTYLPVCQLTNPYRIMVIGMLQSYNMNIGSLILVLGC